MDAPTSLSSDIRKALLLKVISKPQPKREDVNSVIELTSSKVVDALHAQSMTFYVIEGNSAVFKNVYYSPTLWKDNPELEEFFKKKKEELIDTKISASEGVVGKVVQTGEPAFYSASNKQTRPMVKLFQDTGFDVKSMLTVPLKASKVIGAIQVLNKEPGIDNTGEFNESDLLVLQEVAEYSAVLLQRMLDPNFHLSDKDTAKFISRFTNEELVTDVTNLPIDTKLLEMIGSHVVSHDGIFPYRKTGPSSVAVLMTNPLDYLRREQFTKDTDLVVDEVAVAPASLIDRLLKQYFKDSKDKGTDVETTGDMAEIADVIGTEYAGAGEKNKSSAFESEDSAPVIQLANRIIEDAYVCGASDIHIEPHEHTVVVRYRIDGRCQEKLSLPYAVSGALVARIKVMCDLDIAEKRLPQDGRIVFKKFTKKNIDIDLRVATARTNFGEKVVLRILDKNTAAMPITVLGFSEENLEKYRKTIRQPYGMILHCGPTGSGKSMTLFSALREVARPEINVQTAEDPIEYTIPGINQMQMQPTIGLTFARALRAFLRMDPDIILVGEIRDRETAAIAVEAALTGHLLLSTLHTNDAPSTVARFTDMGVEPFMISASLLIICAQRLIRRLCKNCKVAYEANAADTEFLMRAIGWSGEVFKSSDTGCPMCGGQGYKGRIGVHELMVNTDELTRAINAGAESATLKRIAVQEGMKTLHQDSMLKVKDGITSVFEAISIAPPDMLTADEIRELDRKAGSGNTSPPIPPQV
ncbi:MAG: hypothetical protein CO175_08740 [Verrucomicrobia bacterium CG_4_9_14_3_um_filter_43_20]|nr:MAG: hypothetical protein COX01_00495 [Verrucomicrobia bacterium CG22_combo_CG10-13_8_21_14_all_43_17]PIY62631.1 MAG: hypothetical protein COY94_01440 [Verrucomicrobia bacterium CG_4_10_14_0_8_um_filter_43_34]PJA43296.1 MAG: hypothetical protein CO175_08740 [Verrucomicrobia bacterium CG_4_9_14_3_um_filter_43_20]